MTNRRALLVIAAYALLAAIVVPVFPHFTSPNELTRYLLAASIVEHHTIEVTALVPLVGRGFEDLSSVDGRLYSNKAPGAAILALPAYVAARAVFGPPSPESMRGVLTAMRWLGATLPLLLLALFFVRFARAWEADELTTAFVVWVLLFATPLFSYGMLFFSHALVAAALFGAWALLFGLPQDARPNGSAIFAGALLGIAVTSEYPAVIPAAIFCAALLIARSWRPLLQVFAAAVPFAIALALYHDAAFGSPWQLPYGNDALPQFRALAQSGVLGVGVPSPITAIKLLLDPARGLFVFSPILILALPALAAMRRRIEPAAWWTLILACASTFLVYAGYPNWHGGWNVGPRYIAAVIPFLVAALLFRAGNRIVAPILGGASAVAIGLTSLAFPFPPNAFAYPWMSLAAPLLGEGLIAPNVLHLIAPPLAIVAPLALLVLAAAPGFDGRGALYALVGALLAIIIGAAGTSTPDLTVQLQRAYVEEVYFERHGAMQESLPQVPPRLLQRRERELQKPPASWPF